MPTHVISKQVEEYYDSMIYVVQMLHYWPKDDYELQEFLDYGRSSKSAPPEFEDFKEAIASMYYSGCKLGLKEFMGERQLFALARNLCRSEPRQKSYLKTLRAARKGSSGAPEIIPFRELEERYQYHLWVKGQETITGKKPNVDFHSWLQDMGCVTFYDVLSSRPHEDAESIA